MRQRTWLSSHAHSSLVQKGFVSSRSLVKPNGCRLVRFFSERAPLLRIGELVLGADMEASRRVDPRPTLVDAPHQRRCGWQSRLRCLGFRCLGRRFCQGQAAALPGVRKTSRRRALRPPPRGGRAMPRTPAAGARRCGAARRRCGPWPGPPRETGRPPPVPPGPTCGNTPARRRDRPPKQRRTPHRRRPDARNPCATPADGTTSQSDAALHRAVPAEIPELTWANSWAMMPATARDRPAGTSARAAPERASSP